MTEKHVPNWFSPSALPSDAFIIMVVTELDDDDFSSLTNHLLFTKNLVIVCDEHSYKQYQPSGIPCLVTSFSDTSSTVSVLEEWRARHAGRFVGIIGYDEEYHYDFSEAIALRYGLAYHSRETLDACSNKFLQRALLSKGGVPVPRFQLLSDDAQEVDVPFPNVSKIITGISSVFVFKNKDKEELLAHLKMMRSQQSRESSALMNKPHVLAPASSRLLASASRVMDPHKLVLIEEFVGGDEYSCDYLMLPDGTARVLRLVRKFVEEGFFSTFDGFALFSPGDPHAPFPAEDLASLCAAAAKALGIASGLCMMDFKHVDGVLVVIETTVRPGISTFVDLMGVLYGWTSVDATMAFMLGLPLPPQNSLVGVVQYYSLQTPCVIKSIDYSEVEGAGVNFLKFEPYVHVGELVKGPPPGIDMKALAGYALAGPVSFKSIAPFLRALKEKVHIRVELI